MENKLFHKLTVEEALEDYKAKAKDFICIICHYISINPEICSECNCLMCKECLKTLSSCPICRRDLKTESLPKFSLRSLNSIRFKCKNKGCHVQPDYDSYVSHLNKCEFGFTKCANKDCDFKGLKDILKEHDIICPEAIIECLACKSKVKRKCCDIKALYLTFEKRIEREFRLTPKKRQNLTDIYEEVGLNPYETDRQKIKNKINNYFLELIEEGKFIDKVDQYYTVDLLKQYLNERELEVNGYKDFLINYVLMYLLCKKFKIPLEKEREFYHDERAINKFLNKHCIEFNEREVIDTKNRRYLEYKFGDQSNLTKKMISC